MTEGKTFFVAKVRNWYSRKRLEYLVSARKIVLERYCIAADDGHDFRFCKPHFERVTGIKLKLGEVAEVKLAIVKVEKAEGEK